MPFHRSMRWFGQIKSDSSRRVVEPVEKFFHRVHDAGIGCLVSRECGDGRLKFEALHDVENPPHRLSFQKSLAASEDIVPVSRRMKSRPNCRAAASTPKATSAMP